MHIQIRAEKLGPLSILKELPDARLAVLEGLNGIGKTLAIRILELCTGVMPYRIDSPAWQSLCEGLGQLDVRITNLNGAREIQWSANSRDWLDLADPNGPVTFRQIVIDDAPVKDLQRVRQLLVVHRLAGDEGIIETLAQQADSEAAVVKRWRRRYADQENSPLARLERQLGEAAATITDWSDERYEDLKSAVEEAQEAREKASSTVNKRVAHRDSLEEAVRLRRQLQLVIKRAPDLEERLAAVDSEIQRTQAERDTAQSELMALAGQVAGAEALVRELRNARRTRDRNLGYLSDALDTIAVIASELAIEPTEEAVTAVVAELEGLQEALVTEQLAMDAAPTMRQLLDQVTGRLGEAEGAGLADQLAIDDSETDTQLTVAQTRAGMLTRRAQLEGQPPPPQAKEVAERLADVRRRMERAQAAASAFDEADRRRRLAANSEQRVDQALAAMDPQAVRQVQELENQRRASDERILELAAARASLRQQLGSLVGRESAEAMRTRLAEVTKRCGVETDQLDDALDRAEQAVSQADEVLVEANAEVLSAKRELSRANAEIRRAATALTEDADLEWLRQGLSMPSEPMSSTPKSMLTLLRLGRSRVRAASLRLSRHRSQLGAVEQGLTGLGEHLRGHEPNTQEYLPQLEAWLGTRFSAWFNIPRVRSELLPHADGDVVVDLQRREVAWTENEVELFRPLEAFSSGEQAFAYTRARLAILDEEDHHALNRLIALDEFGAFIALDRLSGLMAYLRDRADEHPEDQVLVILPLTRNYPEQAATAIGAEADRLSRLVDEINEYGYAIQELVP